MSDYDFKTLNDKDFEALSTALLSKSFGVHVERFKPGKDLGIDGRFFADDGGEVIVQCKHWIGSGVAKLINHMKTKEIEKIRLVKPERYILTTTLPLSPANKSTLVEALAPFVSSPADILGADDINALLDMNPEIEKQFYKLWLTSTPALTAILNNATFNQSRWHREEIERSASLYVKTENHYEASKILEKHHVLIISGEPGVGKTTLAEQICLELIAEGFALVSISEGVSEARDVFEPQAKQLFLFDDFLGRNYMDALGKNKDSHIVQFIEKVRRDEDKRFILTSRTSILKQGWQLTDRFRIANLNKNEFELRVDDLSRLEKAKILYNHIFFGHLEEDYVDELYANRRYMKVIDHRNFNPRLIKFITDVEKVEVESPSQYWSRVKQWLDNPADIWREPINVQLRAEHRLMLLLVAFNGRSIRELDLQHAFADLYESVPSNYRSGDAIDFFDSAQLLSGSFLNREVDSRTGHAAYDLFSPSIGDYLLNRYLQDEVLSSHVFNFLNTVGSLQSLQALGRGRHVWRQVAGTNSFTSHEIPALLSPESYEQQLILLSAKLAFSAGAGVSNAYRLKLAEMIVSDETLAESCREKLEGFFSELSSNGLGFPVEQISGVLSRAISLGLISDLSPLEDFLCEELGEFTDPDNITEFFSLFNLLSGDAQLALESSVRVGVLNYWCSDKVYSLVSDNGVVAQAFDVETAEGMLADWLGDQFVGYSLDFADHYQEITQFIPLDEMVEDNIRDHEAPDYGGSGGRSSSGPGDDSTIHELFDRDDS